MTSRPKRILILTASMGEGHNTAAKNVAAALRCETPETEVLVADPYTRTNPVINRLVQNGYAMAINRYPRAWKVVFEILSRKGVVEGMGPILHELMRSVESMLREFQPDIVASTYPVFAYLMQKIRRKGSVPPVPFFTIITDSTEINSAWYRWPCDGSIVADEPTADVLRHDGVPEERIHVLGFPVSLAFEGLSPCPPPGTADWKVLFFPGGTVQKAVTTVSLLSEIPGIRLHVVTGKRVSTQRALEALALPPHVELTGWTDQMPALMASHHLFIGKAGGATVQEAIAAQIPFVVSHIVPGQEEGNISFIQRTGIGALASASPLQIRNVLLGALAHSGLVWHAWRRNLEALKKPSASRAIARFLLDRVP